MTTKHRIDSVDTVDSAIHALAKLQAEGWCLDKMEQSVEYDKPSKKSVALPVATVLKIRLKPA